MGLQKRLYIFLLQVLISSQVLIIAQGHEPVVAHQIHPLRPQSGSAGHLVPGLNCLSWRLAVETQNLIDWDTVPKECEGYVGHYMLGAQYRKDCAMVTWEAYGYVKSLELKKDGKNIWIFDIDETSLSNLPYYVDNGFGAMPYNGTSFDDWQGKAKAPAILSVLNFYRRLLRLGVKIVFLTGAPETYREPKLRNMRNIGYHTWEKMILRSANESSMTALEYKSKHRTQLVEEMGYRIIGNIGDQWSDLLGAHPGMRTFKLPDPLYYVS